MIIWTVTEYVLDETDHIIGEEQNVGYYSSKQKAIEAVRAHLLYNFDAVDVENRVKIEQDDDEVYITTECGDDYGMYDCRYEIIPVLLDGNFGE